MRKISCVAIGCAAFLGLLALDASFHASFAQQKASSDEAPYATERQTLREESAAIRADHDALEVEREKLKTQCLDAKGQDKSNCDQEREELHAKRIALRERVKALVDKIHADKHQSRKEMMPQHNKTGAPDGATETVAPDEIDSPPVSMEPITK
jgi:uncharacterized protein (DUF3084 family)